MDRPHTSRRTPLLNYPPIAPCLSQPIHAQPLHRRLGPGRSCALAPSRRARAWNAASASTNCASPKSGQSASLLRPRAKAPCACLERRQRVHQLRLPEIRPEHVAEHELCVCRLPQQEVGEALLAARAEQQVRRADRSKHGGERQVALQLRLVYLCPCGK
eukprot:349741-Chlamydomonas_euryale.AAC.14